MYAYKIPARKSLKKLIQELPPLTTKSGLKLRVCKSTCISLDGFVRGRVEYIVKKFSDAAIIPEKKIKGSKHENQ